MGGSIAAGSGPRRASDPGAHVPPRTSLPGFVPPPRRAPALAGRRRLPVVPRSGAGAGLGGRRAARPGGLDPLRGGHRSRHRDRRRRWRPHRPCRDRRPARRPAGDPRRRRRLPRLPRLGDRGRRPRGSRAGGLAAPADGEHGGRAGRPPCRDDALPRRRGLRGLERLRPAERLPAGDRRRARLGRRRRRDGERGHPDARAGRDPDRDCHAAARRHADGRDPDAPAHHGAERDAGQRRDSPLGRRRTPERPPDRRRRRTRPLRAPDGHDDPAHRGPRVGPRRDVRDPPQPARRPAARDRMRLPTRAASSRTGSTSSGARASCRRRGPATARRAHTGPCRRPSGTSPASTSTAWSRST